MFSSIGTRTDSAIGVARWISFRPTSVLVAGRMETHGQRLGFAERLESGDVVDRGRRREVVAIGGGEGAFVAGDQRRGIRPVRRHEPPAQLVGPCAHDRRQPRLERRLVGRGRLAARAPDDEMDPRQRHAFREGGIVRRDVALEDFAEVLPDPLAHRAVVAVARDEHDDRHVAVELVGPDQRAQPRPLLQRQDAVREGEQQFLVDLEQLVARIGLQHVDQRLAGMALRIVAGARS